jgi:Flp pilus assembly protein TadD
MRPRRALGMALVLVAGTGCAGRDVDSRTLHYVAGELVTSHPVSPHAYEAYLRARLALDAEPPDLGRAAAMIRAALELDPQEPQLWTTLAEVQERAGDRAGAVRSLDRALALRPGYGPAERMIARLEGREMARRQ